VAILDADKEGFLRSATSLIQTIGRTARNVNAEVILYADKVTRSMQKAMDETERRRKIQLKHNKQNNITPRTIQKSIRKSIDNEITSKKVVREIVREEEAEYITQEYLRELEEDMLQAAKELNFEKAAEIRDRIVKLQKEVQTEHASHT
jgi:excinuclease ABC subunit B